MVSTVSSDRCTLRVGDIDVFDRRENPRVDIALLWEFTTGELLVGQGNRRQGNRLQATRRSDGGVDGLFVPKRRRIGAETDVRSMSMRPEQVRADDLDDVYFSPQISGSASDSYLYGQF